MAFICSSKDLFCAENNLFEERSQHFIIHYDKKIDKSFIKDIIDASEDYYEQIADNLGLRRFDYWLWDERAHIYIYANKEEFAKETGQPDWSGGCADYYNKKLWTYPHAVGFFDSVLPHELGHIMFREMVGFRRNVSLWLEEGAASYQEKSKRYAATSYVKDALAKNKLMTVGQLDKIEQPQMFEDDRDKIELFYLEAVSIVNFLISDYGKEKFVTLCGHLKENLSFDNALKQTYYNIQNKDDLNKKWMDFLKK